METVQTNIVIATFDFCDVSADQIVEALASEGVLVSAFGPKQVRFVTHKDVLSADVDAALTIVQRVIQSLR